MSSARAERLAGVLAKRELDAMLVTDLVNVRYLTGFTGTNAVCVIGGQERLFFTDFRYVEQAERQVFEGFERMQGRQDLLGDAVARLGGRVGFEDGHLSVRAHARIADMLPGGVELVSAGGVVEELRAAKEPAELRSMREAAALADGIYRHLTDRGLVGRSERAVALDLEQEMRMRGAEGPSFPSIVAAGANGALPHATPGDRVIERDTLVVVDLGCVVDGYCSDCTRTFATGSLPDDALEVYELVLDAQERALAAVRAGAGCVAVDAVAREVIAAAGHGERFGHGTGHGVGLEIHEGPRLSPSGEGELLEGNVITVEPGVYVPGAYGVRIEDLAVVGPEGPEVLSAYPKALVTVAGS